MVLLVGSLGIPVPVVNIEVRMGLQADQAPTFTAVAAPPAPAIEPPRPVVISELVLYRGPDGEPTGYRLEPTQANLGRVRRRELELGGREEVASLAVSRELLSYNDTWDKVDAMLSEMLSREYRERYADPAGRGWVYSWFLMDHVGYTINPRRRDLGYHNIFDHYRALLRETDAPDDVQWHFHPMSTYREAHIVATSYLNSPHLLESLARRIIDRAWFPNSFRPGFHTERPDAHWFLEQWLPFDFANQSFPGDDRLEQQADVAGDVPRVGARGPGLGPAAAEAAALDLQPAGPGRGDADDEGGVQERGEQRGGSRQQAEHERHADDDLDGGQQVSDGGDDRLGQQVVGADGTDAARGVGELQGARDDPHDARHQACQQPEPVLHDLHRRHHG